MEKVLVVSLVFGACYLLYDTDLVHRGSFLTCNTFVFLRCLRSLFFSSYLRPESNSTRCSTLPTFLSCILMIIQCSLSFYSSNLLEQYLDDDTSTIVLFVEEEGAYLSVRVDSFINR